MPKRGLARHWRIEASRFGAKRGSRCCELSRNEGLRCCGTCCYGFGRLNTVFLLRVPKRFRAMVARAARSLAFRGMSRSFSRHAEPGFPGRRQQFLAPHRAWLLGHARSCHSRPPLGGWRRMWRACAQEVCKPDNSRRAGHAKVANARRCRTNANSAAIILQV